MKSGGGSRPILATASSLPPRAGEGSLLIPEPLHPIYPLIIFQLAGGHLTAPLFGQMISRRLKRLDVAPDLIIGPRTDRKHEGALTYQPGYLRKAPSREGVCRFI